MPCVSAESIRDTVETEIGGRGDEVSECCENCAHCSAQYYGRVPGRYWCCRFRQVVHGCDHCACWKQSVVMKGGE